MTFTPTPEQLAVIAEAKSNESLLISALAGAAKTSTLTLLAPKLPLTPTLCCAFNKKIADELRPKMPGHFEVKTMNALGHAAWGKKTRRRLSVATDKSYTILSELLDRERPEQKKELGDSFGSILRASRLAKSNGYVPKASRSFGTGLLGLDEFLDSIAADLDSEPTDEFCFYLDRVLETSIAQAFEGRIDFDDQIYMSVCFDAPFARYPIILVDEAQDLSPMNHEMIRRMFGGRLIAVGDPYQAIYGFRGAHSSSMSLLRDEFQMKELQLSVSFRCPQVVVELARWRAPAMQFPSWAKPGRVDALAKWGPENIPEGAAIICRNNAPLFSVALRLIRAGRSVEIFGRDIGKNLVNILKKLGKDTLPQVEVLLEIANWEQSQLDKARESRKAPIQDKAACLRVFANAGKTLGESIAFATHLFETTGSVKLMTGHKSKGLEFPTVFLLDTFLIPSKFAQRCAEAGDETQLEQERNLLYVMQTRSQDTLLFVNSEDFDATL